MVWVLGLAGELIIFICTFMRVNNVKKMESKPLLTRGRKGDSCTSWEAIDLIIHAVRITMLFCLCGIYAATWALKSSKPRSQEEEDVTSDSESEETPLLNGSHMSYNTQHRHQEANGRINRNGNGIEGTNRSSEGGCVYKDETAAFYRPEKLPHRTWWEYLRGYSVFFPYLWPRDALKLKAIVMICFLLVIGERATNIMVPLQIGRVTDELAENATMPWKDLSLWMLYRFLQGPSGFLGSIRSLLWIPVSQYSYRALTTAAFEHVHSLSLDFHLGKRTGEVLSALNKGASINQFLEQVTFQVIPMLVDLFVAIYLFYKLFDSTFAVIVGVNTFWYLYITVRMAQTRADQRREMTNADREEEAVKNDSITSYETVKYFNAEAFEFRRYRNAIRNYQEAEAKVSWGLNNMNICQSLVFMCGLLAATMLGSYQVTLGHRKIGDFVTLISYLNQLQGPLNFFGTFYRTIQQAMISGERLLELFKLQPTVVDGPHVQPLKECHGYISWKDVRFAYDDRRTALADLNFECVPGTTTAFVGESGGGKSTVFRLMFRYYNCSEGSIEIDGRDVKDLTIDSVRRYIGVVPQDTILFNESLMYNLKYANQNATDEDVYAACRAASIHDRIMSFPDQYNTKVGERGLRLSGGEKQRVAIARTILKNPKIIMLDEATSALDSHTEQQIQDKLGNLGQGRTLLIIA
jgi:ATP-binding cassette, subfamily B, vacuolar membrane transporter HMT1/ACLQ